MNHTKKARVLKRLFITDFGEHVKLREPYWYTHEKTAIRKQKIAIAYRMVETRAVCWQKISEQERTKWRAKTFYGNS